VGLMITRIKSVLDGGIIRVKILIITTPHFNEILLMGIFLKLFLV